MVISLLQSAMLAPFENLINICIVRDDYLTRQVARFEGKRLQITGHRPAVSLTVTFYPDSISLSPLPAEKQGGKADACVEGNCEDLLGLLVKSKESRPLANPSISISGDVMLVQDIYQCAQNLDIQWEDYLTPVLGDVLSQTLANTFKHGKAWAEDSGKRAKHNIHNYLTEESGALVAHQELKPFLDRLDALRLRIDRLQARTNHLRTTTES